jgi:hypothetical protein
MHAPQACGLRTCGAGRMLRTAPETKKRRPEAAFSREHPIRKRAADRAAPAG